MRSKFLMFFVDKPANTNYNLIFYHNQLMISIDMFLYIIQLRNFGSFEKLTLKIYDNTICNL